MTFLRGPLVNYVWRMPDIVCSVVFLVNQKKKKTCTEMPRPMALE